VIISADYHDIGFSTTLTNLVEDIKEVEEKEEVNRSAWQQVKHA